MVEDSDAGRIQRDREQRRALERLRMEEERRERQVQLKRLREFERSDGTPPDPESGLPTVIRERPATSTSGTRSGNPEPDPSRAHPPRRIGAPLRPPSVAEFLRTDPTERFDIQTLNVLAFPGLVDDAQGDLTLLATIAQRAEALMVRVKHELDDPLTAGGFLRELALRWYRESPEDPDWPTHMPARWAGLFAESRTSGGRLEPWLNLRLWSLRERASRAGPLRGKLRRGLRRSGPAEAAVGRTASQQIHAEVAQAILDDLAAHPRNPEVPLPLVRLSELGVRRQVATINDALAALFQGPEIGPFVILHPNRYPDCEEVVIRPPSPAASGAAMAYSLGPARSARKPSHPGPGGTGAADAGGEGGDGAGETVTGETIWEAEKVAAAAWRQVIDETRRERRRLDAPPKDFRTRAAYAPLRDLLLEDEEFRKAFLAARWRGRPSGLPILVSLLQKGSLSPEVSTDHEYLEAELGELAQGDPSFAPPDGVWKLGPWTVTREGSHKDGFKFRAERTG